MPYLFKPKLIPTLAFVVIFPLLIKLGFWQLDRAEIKKTWIATLASGTELPLSTVLAHPRESQFQGIRLQGQFLEAPTLLLMHQSHQGTPGVHVINLFQIEGEQDPVLVDRGFLPTGKNPPPPPGQPLALRGIIDRPKPDRFILGQNVLDPTQRPLPLQRLDLDELEALLHLRLLPLVVLADQDLGDGLPREWQITPRMPPEKHLGYALQWFGLALCLAVIYLSVNLKKRPR